MAASSEYVIRIVHRGQEREQLRAVDATLEGDGP
jgi:hypothetical protein